MRLHYKIIFCLSFFIGSIFTTLSLLVQLYTLDQQTTLLHCYCQSVCSSLILKEQLSVYSGIRRLNVKYTLVQIQYSSAILILFPNKVKTKNLPDFKNNRLQWKSDQLMLRTNFTLLKQQSATNMLKYSLYVTSSQINEFNIVF